MSKLLKNHKELVFILTILSLILVFMVILTTSLAFFNDREEISGNIQLGELDYVIEVNNFNVSLLLPGDEIDIDVTIKNQVDNKNNLIPFYFRFKILNGEEDYNSNLIFIQSGENYIKSDNYYYYKYKLLQNQSTKILEKIVIDSSLTKENVNNVNLAILVDAVQSEYGAYKEVFKDAPIEWVEFIENN